MCKEIVVNVKSDDRAPLEAVVANRYSLQKHLWRTRSVLLMFDGLGDHAAHTQGQVRGLAAGRSDPCRKR